MDVFTNTEEIVTTAIDENKKIYKRSTSNFFIHLLDCLNKGKHEHMLRYVPNSDNKEFEVIFMNKHYSGWTENDISLFEDSDKYLEQIHGRSLESLDCKGRFRSKMRKCTGKYVKCLNKEKDEGFKCKTVGKYRILKIPQNSYVGQINRNKRKIRRKSRGKEKEKLVTLSGYAPSMVQNMGMETVIGNLDASINVPNVGMETVIGNSGANTNLITLGGSASNMDVTVQNVGMETVIGNSVASINVPNVGIETAIGNSDADKSLVIHGGYPPSMDLNVQNAVMEAGTAIGNSDVSINVQNVGMETVIGNLDASINVPNVGMETVIENLDDYSNFIFGYAPTMDVAKEIKAIIENLDASINVPNVWMGLGNSDDDDDTNMETPGGCFSSVDLNVQNMGMETVNGNSDADAIDSIRKIDDWLCNFQSIC